MSEQIVKCPVCEKPFIFYTFFSGDQSACPSCKSEDRMVNIKLTTGSKSSPIECDFSTESKKIPTSSESKKIKCYKSVAVWTKAGRTEDIHERGSVEDSKKYAHNIVNMLELPQYPEDEKIRGKLIEAWIEPVFE